HKFSRLPSPLQVNLETITSLWDYDQQVTAPLNGFAGADDYYSRCSSRGFLKGITTPTLILHSRDDPFMYPSTLPAPEEVGPGVRLAIQAHGGHVGFIDGPLPWRSRCLIDQLVPAFLDQQLAVL